MRRGLQLVSHSTVGVSFAGVCAVALMREQSCSSGVLVWCLVPVSAVGQRASALRGQPLEPFCRGQNESFLVTYQEPVTESVESQAARSLGTQDWWMSSALDFREQSMLLEPPEVL